MVINTQGINYSTGGILINTQDSTTGKIINTQDTH